MDDFVGFTYNGVHSSELGILRVSSGSRYSEDLLPSFSDRTIQVSGGDETYYFGTNYTSRQFQINIAYDNLSELQFRRLRQIFGDRKIHDLIFDESPYKIYSVKPSSAPVLNYICFDESEMGGLKRVYKGEGTLSFTAYMPFARSNFKFLDQYTNLNFPNKDEWAEVSGLKQTQGNYDKYSNNRIPLFNPGDLEANFILTIKFPKNTTTLAIEPIPSGSISIAGGENANRQLVFSSSINPKGNDTAIRINSRLNLVEGLNSSNIITGNVYNGDITAGVFFKIPQGESEMIITGLAEGEIGYNYLYY